ncbi:hypothetical protein S7335_5578 [Synechococcus sp. PCC 7335]|uniref:arginine synthesis PII-interacting regulator PirA n=1 Tax=Synechococcus sp. (strain ATCC 29403 / PCC 7335) TaxID=91464 RepID=UPI00017ECAD4|nr:DUF4278 domain-containing protein [Synechococcus sp. PCC 7335]EDX87866.1 hypothetical protein S7335_5578 [Synechococcus sp. PCC 7335]
MKLTYRGVEYDYNPPELEVTLASTPTQYRGQQSQYKYVRHVPIAQPAERLNYRGVAYQTTRTGGVQQLGSHVGGHATTHATTPNAWAELSGKLRANSSAAKARRALLEESTALHQQNIARSLQHRMEVAKQKGNQALLEQLESEMRQSV